MVKSEVKYSLEINKREGYKKNLTAFWKMSLAL